jgi:RNA polymerase sigma-54 factor
MSADGCYLSQEDCRHVREHVERVKCILEAIELRKKTLARVSTHLAEYQQEFLLHGPSKLRPLRQKDVAAKLGVHESTICRAVAGKFCRLPSGEVVSFELFFDSAMPIREMISQLIARSTEPLSDGEIAKRLTEQGVTIARRTVAKYRDQLKLLPYQLRAA